ncbi:MAG: hypothetical protein AABO58_18805 [Acidobacteriota bacterium]
MTVVLLLLAAPALADDEFTLYDLLPPETHQFAITYDVTQAREGATTFDNPIRAGAVATKERVIARASGEELRFEVVEGKFIRVHLPGPVPKGGETRIRIFKTYTDAASYGVKDGQLFFERPLGISRNVVLLPKGWQLTGCASPGMVSTDADGRVRVSFVNDRDDQLPVKCTATPAPGAGAATLDHRAEQDRQIRYWLLDPSTHQFRISHDFTVARAGQKSVHSFVRKGSVVSPDARMIDLDTGKVLETHTVTGKDVNALGYYPTPSDPDSVVVQGDLGRAIAAGQSARIRVEETYTDPVGYTAQDGELVWKRTLGRPVNFVTLPAGWILTSVNTPATITRDDEGRIKLRFVNIRNDELSVTIKARPKPTPAKSRSDAFVTRSGLASLLLQRHEEGR